jgi:hypothetical protein
MSAEQAEITKEVHDRQHATDMHGGCPWCRTSWPDTPEVDPYVEGLREDLRWHYSEVARLRTVMTRAVNILTNPHWPGDPDPYLAALQLLRDALKPNSTIGRPS